MFLKKQQLLQTSQISFIIFSIEGCVPWNDYAVMSGPARPYAKNSHVPCRGSQEVKPFVHVWVTDS
jgi:hypothetical protein